MPPPHNTHHNQPFRPVGPSSLLGACWIMKAPPIITKAFWICGRHCCIHPSLTKAAYEILKLIKPLLKCFAFHKSPGPLLVSKWPALLFNEAIILSATDQSWYLSRISRITFVEKKLSCGEISAFLVLQLWGNRKFLYMWRNFSTIDGILLQFMPFCY